MTILLTGSNGFIGRAFKSSSLNKILTIKNADEYLRNADEFNINLINKSHIKNFIKDIKGLKIDAIFHCAAITPFSSKINLNYEHDLLMAKSIISISNHLKVNKIVFTSAWNVYDPANKIPFTEDSKLSPSTKYGLSKLRVENYFKKYLKHKQLINMRFSSIYGPGQVSSGLIPNLVRSALTSKKIIINSVRTKRDYLFINDATDAIEKILTININSHIDINIGSGKSYSVKEVAKKIQKIMAKIYNKEIKIIISPKSCESIPIDNRLDIRKARKFINFYPSTKLIDGLTKYILWVKQNI